MNYHQNGHLNIIIKTSQFSFVNPKQQFAANKFSVPHRIYVKLSIQICTDVSCVITP
jgi:hypothetical protein